MALADDLSTALKEAMKAKDKPKLDAIRQIQTEIAKKKSDTETNTKKDYLETQARQKLAQKMVMDEATQQKRRIKMEADQLIKDLQPKEEMS